MKISKRGAVRSVPENSPICPYPSPPHTPLPSMCVPSICQLLDLTLSACNVRAGCARGGRGAFSAALQEEENDAQWEASSAFKLFLLFAKCLWNNAASNAAACLARHCPLALRTPPPPPRFSRHYRLAMLLLIAIMPASRWHGLSGGSWPPVWGRLCLLFRFNFGYMSTWSEGLPPFADATAATIVASNFAVCPTARATQSEIGE